MAAGNKTKLVATEFDSIIQGDRQRRKHAALAEEIFGRGKGRRGNGGASTKKSGSGGAAFQSLSDRISNPKNNKAQRIASKTLNPTAFKSSTSSTSRSQAVPAASFARKLDAEWTHDLHDSEGDSASYRRQSRRTNTHNHHKSDNGATLLREQVEIVSKLHPAAGMSIRGLAGPYTIIAENFAIGTTAEDIQSAMAPIGGVILKCTVNGTSPVTSEITFESKEGADNVVAQFHGQIADGNALSLYHKIAVALPQTSSPIGTTPPAAAPSGPRNDSSRRNTQPRGTTGYYAPPQHRERISSDNNGDNQRTRNDDNRRANNDTRGNIVDGTYGFSDDEMDVDRESSQSRPTYNNRSSDRRGPYGNDRRDERPRGRNQNFR